MTMHRSFVTGLLIVAALGSGAAFGAPATDQAPSPDQQMVNPSKAEPMMIEPSPDAQAAAYRRDMADCDSHSAEGREICRDMVNEQYGVGPDRTGSVDRCDGYEGTAKTNCLRGASASDEELRAVKSPRLKKETGQRPGFVA